MHEPVQETILNRPLVHFGREVCGDLNASLRREWLVTNGLGGYASATLSGTLTRSYHGLLVAALDPPVGRTVLVAGLDEWANYGGKRYPLSTHEFKGPTVAPQGFRSLESFRLEGALPVWTFAVADALIEKRVWMPHRKNATLVQYRLLRGSGPMFIEVIPLLSYRGFHELQSGHDQSVKLCVGEQEVSAQFGETSHPLFFSMETAKFEPIESWWWDVHFREETARGLQDTGDLYAAGAFHAELQPGESVRFIASVDSIQDSDPEISLESAQARQLELVLDAGAESDSPMVQQLVLAADQFVVTRPLPGNPDGESIIAGYHWFNDWGRDTMISLPGLCLETGRTNEASAILRTFAKYVDRGLLPNNFPDRAGIVPGYNTVDATLWYVVAIYRYLQATADEILVAELLPVLRDIVQHHREGTHFHVAVDPEDGLLAAGEPGVQLTWMDAKIGDWVVTPRIGKPVEINALWYNTLRIVAKFEKRFGTKSAATAVGEMAAQTRASFLRRFLKPGFDRLADVVDGPAGDDWSMRPNQIFALSLPFPLVEGADARRILDGVGAHLLTSYGLRSLSADDPAYIDRYGGDQLHRDAAYHQGIVWSWLLGPFAEARFRLDGDADSARQLLSPMEDHLRDAGLGSVSEIFDAQAPFLPRGCIAQAWGVAETLRVLRMVDVD